VTEHAAENNAAWCELVCGAHGMPGVFHEHYWLNEALVPRAYPNMVTLSGGRPAAEAQTAKITEAIEGSRPIAWSVKDSFSSLALDSIGFDRLLDAHWIWRPPPTKAAAEPATDTSWSRVTESAELARWEYAWAASPVPPGGRILPDSLARHPDVAVFQALREGHIVGGGIANLAGGVIGLSNLFGMPGESEALWHGAVAAAASVFPGIPLVGYEHGEALAQARAAGFEAMGPVTVWVIWG
jgi:hypothetical protein